MEHVTIWYLSDRPESEKLVEAIKNIGLMVNRVSGYDLKDANINEHEINIFLVDIYDDKIQVILENISADSRLHSSLKFILLPKKEVQAATKMSYNLMHVEFIAKPVYMREFLLLLEKSVIVERYREIMKFISKEAESRIESYEGLMDINRKNIFESEKEKQAFEKIMVYEKNLMREQSRLNKAIKDFTLMRQNEIFDMKNRIRAEEMLSDLRRMELLDAHNVIEAQESVIDYSAHEFWDAKKIISASETVAELGRKEAIELHKELTREKEINRTLEEVIEKLKKEIKDFKSQGVKKS